MQPQPPRSTLHDEVKRIVESIERHSDLRLGLDPITSEGAGAIPMDRSFIVDGDWRITTRHQGPWGNNNSGALGLDLLPTVTVIRRRAGHALRQDLYDVLSDATAVINALYKDYGPASATPRSNDAAEVMPVPRMTITGGRMPYLYRGSHDWIAVDVRIEWLTEIYQTR